MLDSDQAAALARTVQIAELYGRPWTLSKPSATARSFSGAADHCAAGPLTVVPKEGDPGGRIGMAERAQEMAETRTHGVGGGQVCFGAFTPRGYLSAEEREGVRFSASERRSRHTAGTIVETF